MTLLLAWLVLFALSTEPFLLLVEYGGFSLLGVVGAIFANATGAGGGVIFVPFFNQLAFTPGTTVATSFAIQCCGMTAGALTWWTYYAKTKRQEKDWSEIGWSLKLTVPFSILGIWAAQYVQFTTGGVTDAESLHVNFGIFSILLAISIFATIPKLKKQKFEQQIKRLDIALLPIIAFAGGVVTAWLSIGVGELIAVYLIIRGFNVAFSIAVAVILSAFSVWAGVLYHVMVTDSVYWPVVMFAGAGAIVGGMLAKHLVLYFSATHLKVFFASWVLLLGVSTLYQSA